ncbi:hypothetical protein F2Q69_00031424 [Brassica cretica]|uniref:Uncharacterized protein n=1 Tax=Brassica cretica TaxID=69181 RepID=A0A8S9RVT1_BRACR|nr:hypothetical protein F2Q69_00031424 [Brassica cretica]
MRGAVNELSCFYKELEQLPSVEKLWISPRHGVRTVTFWWGSYESAHSMCASSMLMKLQVKKVVVSRHWYLELMIRVWSWIKPFDDGRMSEERGRQRTSHIETFKQF